jgi:hypothetical protein
MKPIETKTLIAVAAIMTTPIGIQADVCYGDTRSVPWDQVLESPGLHAMITCGYNNTPCLMYPNSYCKDVSSYQPDPGNFILTCFQSEEPTDWLCDYEQKTVSQHYYAGVPYCNVSATQPNTCDSGCKDWDTEISETSTTYWEASKEDCPSDG